MEFRRPALSPPGGEVTMVYMETSATMTPIPAPGTAEAPTASGHIEVRPGHCGGQPRVVGHRIKVKHIAIWYERMGMSPDEIVSSHPGLTLGQVHAALAYYYDHREQIDQSIREGEELADRIRAGAPSIFDKVRRRNAQDDPLPPG